MLDRWFMKYLSAKGILWYWVGQLSFAGLLALILFGLLGMSMDDGLNYMIGFVVVFVIVWGFICKALWPKEEVLT